MALSYLVSHVLIFLAGEQCPLLSQRRCPSSTKPSRVRKKPSVPEPPKPLYTTSQRGCSTEGLAHRHRAVRSSKLAGELVPLVREPRCFRSVGTTGKNTRSRGEATTRAGWKERQSRAGAAQHPRIMMSGTRITAIREGLANRTKDIRLMIPYVTRGVFTLHRRPPPSLPWPRSPLS